MFAQWLDMEELVKLGDAMMRRYILHEMMTIQDFVDFLDWVDDYARRNHRYAPRGIMKCRKALPLMAQGTDSAAETMLRLILIRYGLPILASIIDSSCMMVHWCFWTLPTLRRRSTSNTMGVIIATNGHGMPSGP